MALTTTQVLAAETNGCQPVFGGGSSCVTNKKFTLDKKVRNLSGAYVDSLGINDDKLGPNAEVVFRILVVNTTNSTLKNLTLTDILPSQLSFVSSDNGGKFDAQSHSVTINIASMEKTEQKLITIKAKTPATDKLGDAPLCLVNQAYGAVGRDKADDNSKFCIAKTGSQGPVQPASTQGGPTPTQPSSNQGQSNTKGGQPIASNTKPSTTKGGMPLPTSTPRSLGVVGPTTVPNMTKGGQPVYPAPQSEVAPNTGPEALALVGLIPTALGGLLLRRKAKN